MDTQNRFHTAGTYWLARAEQVALFGLCGGLMLWHLDALNWGRGLIAFSIIDIVGYLPGAIAYRYQRGGTIAPVYHYLYNFAHTYLVVGAGVGVWAWVTGGVEWAMLAVPLHLSIDRGIFGNVFKPLTLAFEPVAAPPDVVTMALGRNTLDRQAGMKRHV